MADGFQSPPDLNASAMVRRMFSVADVDAMFEAQILSREEKIELIDGEIIQMNSQMMPHGVLKMRILKALLPQVSGDLEVSNELTVQLSKNALVDPDILITPKLSMERRYLQSDELLLAIEVADTSLAFDLGIKAGLYARASIPELWVVDINGARTWVHREPSATGYRSIVSIPFGKDLAPLIDGSAKVTIGDVVA